MIETTYIHRWIDGTLAVSNSADHFGEPEGEHVTKACAEDCPATSSDDLQSTEPVEEAIPTKLLEDERVERAPLAIRREQETAVEEPQ